MHDCSNPGTAYLKDVSFMMLSWKRRIATIVTAPVLATGILVATPVAAEARYDVRSSASCKGFGGKLLVSAWSDLNNHVTMRKKGKKVCVARKGPNNNSPLKMRHKRYVIEDGLCNHSVRYESYSKRGSRPWAVVVHVGDRLNIIEAGRFTRRFEPSATAC